MAKYLMSIRGGLDVTVGKVYEIERETPYAYYVRDDVNDERECLKLNDGVTYVAGAVGIIEAKRTQLATLTAEIAELEEQLAEESRLKVGDYAQLTERSMDGDLREEDIVIVRNISSMEGYSHRVKRLLDGEWDFCRSEDLTKITPAEARASLIAKIDAHFGGQEAK